MRLYAKGRPYVGLVRGEAIVRPDEVVPGDLLIAVNHDSGCENLLEVHDQGPNAIVPEKKFYGRWLFGCERTGDKAGDKGRNKSTAVRTTNESKDVAKH